LVGVSAGYSNPGLRDSIGDMVNGIFVSDFAATVNAKALLPDTVPIANAFFKRYDEKLKRPPAGHASSSFSATWALLTEVLPKAKNLEPAELRGIALKLDLPPRSLANGSGIKFTNNDWSPDPKDAGQNLRASIGVWQWAEDRQQPSVSDQLGEAGSHHGAAADVQIRRRDEGAAPC
jgi:branched-chain amino acid transport system substrate-binding protein